MARPVLVWLLCWGGCCGAGFRVLCAPSFTLRAPSFDSLFFLPHTQVFSLTRVHTHANDVQVRQGVVLEEKLVVRFYKEESGFDSGADGGPCQVFVFMS